MINFYWKNTRLLVALIILSIVLIPLAVVLPKEYGFENHLLENIEVIILSSGIIINLLKIRDYTIYESVKFYIASILVFVLMIGRELNWGRVFYPVMIKNDGDVVFISLNKLWYGSVVYPLVAILIVIVIGILLYYIYQSRLKNIYWYIPLGEFFILVLMSILSQCVFEQDYITSLGDYNQMLEEICEILSYLALVSCSYQTYFVKKYVNIKYFSMI